MRLVVESVGVAALAWWLTLAAAASAGLVGFAAGPELLAAWQQRRLVVRHASRSRRSRHVQPTPGGTALLAAWLDHAARLRGGAR